MWVIPTLLSKLFEIIDNMMTLSTELQSSLESKIKQFEEERTMPLVSNMELRGMERGKEIGKEIGFFVTCYGSIGWHKSTKSLSGERFN